MVTTANTAIAPTTTTTNNGNMLLYNNNNTVTTAVSSGGESAIGGLTTCNTSATLEQYRLQLYNYALNMERIRGPPYTAAAAMAAAAAYASTTTVSTTSVNGPNVHAANYTTTVQGPPPQPPTPTSYLCATTAGSLISATTHIGRTPSSLGQCPASNRLALASMSLFPQRIFQPEEPKPQHSYIGLIAMAILSSADTKLVLSDIYQYILDNYPYFRTRGPGWRNSIRHNLSLNDCFIKSGRSANGKGHYWAIHPANMEDFRKGDFRRRKAQRKVRKHMGLAVDDNGTDSPSPPPAMDITSPSPPSFQHIIMGSSTITAAQHLAAQSFGWRLTHQHHRQQAQNHATNGTAASYMGQIFTYRPQHYAAAAAAAAALCHSGNTQQQQQQQQSSHHHQQQQLITTTSLQQHHSPEFPLIQPTTVLATQPYMNENNVSANVIHELFSQKRKRQFDVASLLAPDYTTKRELQQHQQRYMRKQICESETDEEVRLPASFNDEILVVTNQTPNELDIEDIDVVEASEDEDIENDYDERDDEVDSNSNSQSRTHSHSRCNSHHSQHDDDEVECIKNFHDEHQLNSKSNHCKISKINKTNDDGTMLRLHDYEPEDDCDEEQNEETEVNDESENINEKNQINHNNRQDEMHLTKSEAKTNNHLSSPLGRHIVRINSPPLPPSAPHLLTTHPLIEQHTNEIQYSNAHTSSHYHHQLSPINSDAHNLFGRYYGTYMVAAAARMNSSMAPVNIVGNTD